MDLNELFSKILYVDRNIDKFIEVYGEMLTENERALIKKDWSLYTKTYGKTTYDIAHNLKIAIRDKFKDKSMLWFLRGKNRMQVAWYEAYVKYIAERELEKARMEGKDV